jgi:hypothetical protein
MTEARPQNKATIQEAAKTLHVDRKTIYRWISKGLISKYVEENKTYVILEEVKAICGKGVPQEATSFVAENVASPNIVTVDRPHYEGLLIKLGQYEAERRYLLEYKEGLEAKDKELAAVKTALEKNGAELDQARATIAKARSELQRLIEIKQDAEAKGKALIDQQAALEVKERELAEILAELDRARLPFWKRWFKK